MNVHESLPSRGAWIEITTPTWWTSGWTVAPLAGSVDRNGSIASGYNRSGRRSPRGERG